MLRLSAATLGEELLRPGLLRWAVLLLPDGVSAPLTRIREWVRRDWVSLGEAQLMDGHSVQAFEKGPCRVLVAQEGGRWHLSISCPDRYPSWDEIADARYKLLADDVDMAFILPPLRDYINLHPFVFNLWQVVDTALPIERGDAMPRSLEDRSLVR